MHRAFDLTEFAIGRYEAIPEPARSFAKASLISLEEMSIEDIEARKLELVGGDVIKTSYPHGRRNILITINFTLTLDSEKERIEVNDVTFSDVLGAPDLRSGRRRKMS